LTDSMIFIYKQRYKEKESYTRYFKELEFKVWNLITNYVRNKFIFIDYFNRGSLTYYYLNQRKVGFDN